MLTDATDFDRVFFCNSGTESVEAAIKLSRKYATETHGPHKHEVLTFSKSFHGRTYGGLSATAQPALKDGFGPMLPGIVHAPFGDLEAAKDNGRSADGRRTRRAHPGRRRHKRAATGFPGRLARALRRARGIAHLRRGPDRRGAHGTSLRLPGDGRRPRRAHERQGPWGRLPRRGYDGQGRVRRARSGQPRLHLRG